MNDSTFSFKNPQQNDSARLSSKSAGHYMNDPPPTALDSVGNKKASDKEKPKGSEGDKCCCTIF
jgi:hypothetical protein